MDSLVASLIIHKAVKDQLVCIFVDNGLLRKGQYRSLMEVFRTHFSLNVVGVDASELFLEKLQRVRSPERKRMIIGGEFIRIFEREAARVGGADFLAQGTIYPDVIESNPVKKGNYFPEDEYRRDRILTHEEGEKLYETAAPHLKVILICALSTGMRLSEILGLKWEDVDLVKRQIRVRPQSSKSGKQRAIPINSTFFSVLEGQQKLDNGRSDDVFRYEDPETGILRPVKTVRWAFTMACRRAGIENLQFHDLRHTFGSKLIENGADPVSVKDLLGHANLKTT